MANALTLPREHRLDNIRQIRVAIVAEEIVVRMGAGEAAKSRDAKAQSLWGESEHALSSRLKFSFFSFDFSETRFRFSGSCSRRSVVLNASNLLKPAAHLGRRNALDLFVEVDALDRITDIAPIEYVRDIRQRDDDEQTFVFPQPVLDP